jgi:hypothetical protein
MGTRQKRSDGRLLTLASVEVCPSVIEVGIVAKIATKGLAFLRQAPWDRRVASADRYAWLADIETDGIDNFVLACEVGTFPVVYKPSAQAFSTA